MLIRTYYWHARIISKFTMRYRQLVNWNPSRYFIKGNAGDLIGPALIRARYGAEPLNANTGGKRLLMVGSVASVIQPGDVLCGIGVKSREEFLAQKRVDCEILGLRGPLSYDLFKRAGYDVSKVKFLGDPGLIISELMGPRAPASTPERIIFVPHYRERFEERKRMPSGMEFVDIDTSIEELGRAIDSAKLVLTSSLHGIIIAHALGRPCAFIRPQTEEPLFKYEDYFQSVGLTMPKPIARIDEVNYHLLKDEVPSIKPDQVLLPALEELMRHEGVVQ